MENNKRLLWIDCLRVLACFGVVWLHSGARMMDDFAGLSGFEWWVCNIYFNSVRCRIPLFLMISGAVILPKVYDSLGVYLRRRVLRLVWPFVFWTLMYIPLRIYLLHRSGTMDMSYAGFVFTSFRDGISHYYWYIYMIIGLNLFFPILGGWIRRASTLMLSSENSQANCMPLASSQWICLKPLLRKIMRMFSASETIYICSPMYRRPT